MNVPLYATKKRGCLISFFKALKIEYLKNYSGRSTNKKRVSLTFETPSFSKYREAGLNRRPHDYESCALTS